MAVVSVSAVRSGREVAKKEGSKQGEGEGRAQAEGGAKRWQVVALAAAATSRALGGRGAISIGLFMRMACCAPPAGFRSVSCSPGRRAQQKPGWCSGCGAPARTPRAGHCSQTTTFSTYRAFAPSGAAPNSYFVWGRLEGSPAHNSLAARCSRRARGPCSAGRRTLLCDALFALGLARSDEGALRRRCCGMCWLPRGCCVARAL